MNQYTITFERTDTQVILKPSGKTDDIHDVLDNPELQQDDLYRDTLDSSGFYLCHMWLMHYFYNYGAVDRLMEWETVTLEYGGKIGTTKEGDFYIKDN